MLRIVAVMASLAAIAVPAFADYYVIREKETKECKVVETIPTEETTWVQVGPVAFETQEEAEKEITVLCKD